MRKSVLRIVLSSFLLFVCGCQASQVDQQKIKTMGQVMGLDLRQEIQETRPENRIETEEHLRTIGYVQ